ncbi:Modifier of mdg4 [Operophtera brumata]|uniref:Modifier of mdg4 n=1 Tax=Operophtera brumata TaxID=104452 RepID=A0A0L7KQH9_OPEBR|nr:Modifier of mdg4 [Operophtera brumata]
MLYVPPVPVSGTSLKYTLSVQNTVQLVLNRYLYCFHYKKQNGEKIWRCFNTKTCRARLAIKNNKIMKRSVYNSHLCSLYQARIPVQHNATARNPYWTVGIRTTLQYTVSNMGTLQIVLNRYLYCLRNVKKNGERVWKCINFCKGMCLARIVVKDNKVVKRSVTHEQ